MSMFDNEDDKRLNERNKHVVVGAIVSFFFLGILAILSSVRPTDKVFGLSNFYESNVGEEIDPKVQYNKMFKNVIADAVTCSREMKKAKNPTIAGNNVWLADGRTLMSKDELKSMAVNNNDLSVIKPFKSGDLIVSPAELTFMNSNVLQDEKGKVSIKASIGKKYIIEFSNVKSWWCHVGKSNPSKHTDVVGIGGINSKCVEGYIIGEAKKDTEVKLFKVDGSNQIPCDFSKLYKVGKGNGAANSSNNQSSNSSSKKTKVISYNTNWKYANYSKIHSGKSKIYYASSNRKNKIVCINAGHGTDNSRGYTTQSHPDGSPKISGGTNAAGSKTSNAIASGMTFLDGTPEREATLKAARIVKDKLLKAGYDVLMIRESNNVELDNIARTVMANYNADCHIALHYDSTDTDKGAFYMSVPKNNTYRNMEPVKSQWKNHERLGKALIDGLKSNEVKIWINNPMANDLTQTSYSTIPSIDLELGDKKSKRDDAQLEKIAKGIVKGVNDYY